MSQHQKDDGGLGMSVYVANKERGDADDQDENGWGYQTVESQRTMKPLTTIDELPHDYSSATANSFVGGDRRSGYIKFKQHSKSYIHESDDQVEQIPSSAEMLKSGRIPKKLDSTIDNNTLVPDLSHDMIST